MQETTLLGANIVVQLVLYNQCTTVVVQPELYPKLKIKMSTDELKNRTQIVSIFNVGLLFRGIWRFPFCVWQTVSFFHFSPRLSIHSPPTTTMPAPISHAPANHTC